MSRFNDIHDDFPLLQDLEGEQLTNFQKLRDHLVADSKITDTSMYGSFIDDHIPNYNVSIVVEGNEYKFCMGWIDEAGIIFHLARAPHKEESHNEILQYLMAYLKDI